MVKQKITVSALKLSLLTFLLLGPTFWSSLSVSDVEAYVSPGNFYEPGGLSVQVINVPNTTAPVELDIYTPVTPDVYPLVIFQHGFTASIKGYETISTHLASHGFVVVLPQMYPPGGGGGEPTPEEEAALGVQIVSWLEANINNIITPVTADTGLLGLSGHSRGGQIAYRMTLQVTEKVKALAGVDPVDGLEIFGQTLAVTGPLSFDIPTYILGTGLGPIVVGGFLACAPKEIGPFHFYCANPNPTWLAVATTHGHADMIDEEDYSDVCPGGPDRDGMRAFTAGTLAAFFSGTLQGNEIALLVLSDPESAPVPATMEMNKMGQDTDLDEVCDVCDNCPDDSNPDQSDFDQDGLGDICDPDDDNDGICDPGKSDPSCSGSDTCPFDPQNDSDVDGICGDVDCCFSRPNSPSLGTCIKTQAGMVVSYRVGNPKQYINCTSDADCISTGGTCQLAQGDSNSNGVGDVCECYANFNYPTDLKVNSSDLGKLKLEFGRIDCKTTPPACTADGNNDGKVNSSDLGLLKNEFGRIDCPVIP